MESRIKSGMTGCFFFCIAQGCIALPCGRRMQKSLGLRSFV